jgi:NADH dehydrogenase/NADH:ubiquinone oxidoreductase subunit G
MEMAREPDWEAIISEYDLLTHELPKDERPLVQHQIRLAKARARLELLDVAGSIEDLTALLKEAAQVHGEDAPITRATREALGKANYYATYLLKTNGAAEEEWRPFAERTRQIFRFLAEHQDPAALAQYERRVEAELGKTIEKRNR